jgi:hypothetical protein
VRLFVRRGFVVTDLFAAPHRFWVHELVIESEVWLQMRCRLEPTAKGADTGVLMHCALSLSLDMHIVWSNFMCVLTTDQFSFHDTFFVLPHSGQVAESTVVAHDADSHRRYVCLASLCILFIFDEFALIPSQATHALSFF